jgi:hypothetical protein
MSVLSEAQVREYEEQGFLLVSGLIPEPTAAAAEAAMWRVIGAEPGRPETWSAVKPNHHAYDDPALTAVYTPDFCAAAAQLGGDDPANYVPPRRAYVINIFPQEGEWRWPSPHIDHALKDAGHHVFPRAFRIAAMTFLSDVPPHGAGTIVWPGSHRKLEALAKSDPERYELMWALSRDIDRADLAPPLEMTPRRGDVLFYHYLCAHSGSMNTSDCPRLALNMKW